MRPFSTVVNSYGHPAALTIHDNDRYGGTPIPADLQSFRGVVLGSVASEDPGRVQSGLKWSDFLARPTICYKLMAGLSELLLLKDSITTSWGY